MLKSVELVPLGIEVNAFSIAERVDWSISADVTDDQHIYTIHQGHLPIRLKWIICRCSLAELLSIEADSFKHLKAARCIPTCQLPVISQVTQLAFTNIDLKSAEPCFDSLPGKFL